MTDDPRNEPDARLADALSRWHAEVEPPPRVEDRLVAALTARGDILEPRSLRPWLVAAVMAALLLLAVLFLRRPETIAPAGTGEGSEFMLLIAEDARYTPPADSAEARARVAEYTDWAGKLAGGGHLVSAGELAYSGTDVRTEGKTASVIDSRGGAISGYFLVRAHSLAQAEQLAAESPHLRYGGTVVVRPIVH
ncbi:MAG TPA: hypothetical protein VJU15_00975 [Gemmatimonadales bacterium]|nr:hypothetical protein [Gemmatimonadales bacterium]